MDEVGENPIPFFEKSHKIQEETWGGAENKVSSIALNIPEGTNPDDVKYDHVLKEPREVNYFDALAKKYPPETDDEKQAIKDLSDYFNSREHFTNTQKDYQLMGEIFGDLFPKTQFIIGEPREGNRLGFYIIQEKIKGESWTNFSKNRISIENQTFLMSHKEQLVRLIGGARKVLVELGATVDIWGDNLIIDRNGGIVFIDPGSPSELERHFDELLKLPKDMRSFLANNLLKGLNDLDRYPSVVEMTDDEIRLMNEKVGITDAQYAEANEKLRKKCETLLTSNFR